MKIVFIEDSSFMGGVQYSTFFLAEQIIKEHHKTHKHFKENRD